MDNDPFSQLLSLIDNNKLTELEAERLLNAAARFRSGVPTGTTLDPAQQHKHRE